MGGINKVLMLEEENEQLRAENRKLKRSFNKKLVGIYKEIDMECISETDTVKMEIIRNVFVKHGCNKNDLD